MSNPISIIEPSSTSKCYDPMLPYLPPIGRLPVLGKMRAEIDQIRAGQALQLGQIRNEAQRTVNDTTRATNDSNKTIGELAALADKTLAEVTLLNQKTQTELAQVSDTVNTGAVEGVVGKQKDLFQKQTDGFDRDAEQKLAKIMVDTWSVRMTVDGTGDSATAGINDAEIAAVLAKAKTGINATPVIP
jgi:hypothetical protein